MALDVFMAACTAAGKRLCTKDEWFEACNGPDDATYFFGNVWNPEICNNVDTFCDDYCVEHGISSCNTAENCGYQYNCFHVMPTGSFPSCSNAYGLYDVNGNVWEIVPSDSDYRGYEVRGGAFNCASPSIRLQCLFNASWNQLYVGFRCCKDRDLP
jgi:formylglycine-generating enzyme required for sulfatase activity